MNTINFIAAFMYLICSAIVVRSLIQQHTKPTQILYWIAAAALTAHAFTMLPQLISAKGYYLSIAEIGSLLWLIISFILTITAYRTENLLLLPLAYWVSMGTLGWIGFSQSAVAESSHLSTFLVIHLSVALLTFSSTLLASLYAIQVQAINYLLKHRRPLAINRWVPPLMQVERVLFRLIGFATLLLTCSLISGVIFSDNLFAQGTLHKTLLSILAWFIFVAVLFARFSFRLRGKWITGGTLVGTLVLSLAYFGSRFVQEILLS